MNSFPVYLSLFKVVAYLDGLFTRINVSDIWEEFLTTRLQLPLARYIYIYSIYLYSLFDDNICECIFTYLLLQVCFLVQFIL